MSKYMAKPRIVDAFEYGSGDFPIWFNTLVGNLVTIFNDNVYTPNGKYKAPAGKVGNKIFHYGDIISKDSRGYVQVYDKYDFVRKYILIEK